MCRGGGGGGGGGICPGLTDTCLVCWFVCLLFSSFRGAFRQRSVAV